MSDEAGAVAISECRREDLPEIGRILGDAPEAAMWSEEALAAALDDAPEQFLVARNGKEIRGFILGRVVGSETEILNLAVKKEFRRAGVGTALVNSLLGRYEQGSAATVFLEVRESNVGAITFYERLGFWQVGRRAGYYRGPVEAALVLRRVISNR